MAEVSTKPYLIRALYEWCADSGYRPFIAVVVDEHTQVPREFVRDGEIVLNIAAAATNRLHIGNELLEFEARFSGVARHVSIPIDNISAIFAQETGHGMAFEVPTLAGHDDDNAAAQDAEARTDRGTRHPSAGAVEAEAPPADASADDARGDAKPGPDAPGHAADGAADGALGSSELGPPGRKAGAPRPPRRARKTVLRAVEGTDPAPAPEAGEPAAATPAAKPDDRRAKPRSRRPSISAVPPSETPTPVRKDSGRATSGPDDDPGPGTPTPGKPRLTRVK